MEIIGCPECGGRVSISVSACPHCGARTGLSIGARFCFAIIFFLIPVACIFISSILYFVWRDDKPKKARQINSLGWMIIFSQISLIFIITCAALPEILPVVLPMLSRKSGLPELPKQEEPPEQEYILPELLPTSKRSLRVNINTASSDELQSLPGIGPARAESIVAHRPYESTDELANVKGIPRKVLEEIRPLVKTDGNTEKIKPSN
jgi:competence ComEA-like helix-hairpin-helix protein